MSSVSILEALVLKLENEKVIYEEINRKFLLNAKEIRDQYKIGLDINKFLDEVHKLSEEEKDIIEEKYKEFINKKINDTETFEDIFYLDLDSVRETKIRYGIRISKDLDLHLPQNAVSKMFQINQGLKTVGERAIVSVVQYFEEFFSSLLNSLIQSKPEAYFCNKSIEYKDLMKSSIEEIKKQLLENEVSNLMYSVKDTIEKIDKIHKLHLENYSDLINQYIEIDMHKNIIVHNKGCVNAAYNINVAEIYKKKEGQYIKCDKELINEAITGIIKFSYLLCYLIWKNERELDVLETVAFKFLCDEKWELAKFAHELLYKIPDIKNDRRLNYRINYLNAVKHIEGLDKTINEIEKFDTSGMEEIFYIAKQLLLENNSEVLNCIEHVYPRVFNAYTIIKWPIFIEFRKTKEFQLFINKHQYDFEEYNFDTQSNTKQDN